MKRKMVVKHLVKIAGRYKKLISAYLIIGMTYTFLQNFGAYYFQQVVDNFTGGTLTVVSITIYGSVLILQYIMGYLWNYPDQKLQFCVSLALKIEALRKVHEAFFTIFAILIGFVKIGIILYGWAANALTIGQIVALIALVDNAYTPIAIFNVEYVDYKLNKIAFARYTEFLDSKEDDRLSQGKAVPCLEGNIVCSNMGFCYDERVIFNDFNLHIQKGKTVAFVGESGSGKSTAVKLIVGLLQPNRGQITVDGFDLKKINLNNYYEHIAYLPQEPSIFNGSLRENLVFDRAIDDDALIKALEKVGLENLYSKLENGLDTQLGEKGVSLSGGERQQLALARLWFSNASTIIFDEATSAIDNLTEEAVMKNVIALLAGKTVIAIAHRLDSVKSFDDLVVFQDGHIVERGKFVDLIDNHKYFYELYHRSLA